MQVFIVKNRVSTERRKAFHKGFKHAFNMQSADNRYRTIQRHQEYIEGYAQGRTYRKTFELAMLMYYEIKIPLQFFNYFISN